MSIAEVTHDVHDTYEVQPGVAWGEFFTVAFQPLQETGPLRLCAAGSGASEGLRSNGREGPEADPGKASGVSARRERFQSEMCREGSFLLLLLQEEEEARLEDSDVLKSSMQSMHTTPLGEIFGPLSFCEDSFRFIDCESVDMFP